MMDAAIEGELVKEFVLRFALHTGRKAEFVTLQVGDDARYGFVYRTAASLAPQGKQLVAISFKGKVLWQRGWWYRGPRFREAFGRSF